MDAEQVRAEIKQTRASIDRKLDLLSSRTSELTEAAKIGYLDVAWPTQYRSAKTQLERNLERERAAQAQTTGLSPLEQANRSLGV